MGEKGARRDGGKGRGGRVVEGDGERERDGGEGG